jgi:glycosyltransferase involved in cell wall biosynthesis
MRVLIVTDAFPPRAGGSGWSTYEVARGLRARGHEITVVRPRFEAPARGDERYDGFDVIQPRYWAPRVPFVRNYFRNERLYASLTRTLAPMIRDRRIDIVHGQHLLSGPGAIRAARQAGVASVCTIRDYWPLCYWSDSTVDPASGVFCPACSPKAMTRCLKPRGGWMWPLGLTAIPYMAANLRGKRQALAGASAIVAVSQGIASDLCARALELSATRVEVIPNPVDVDGIAREAADLAPPLAGAYALYVGKLAHNKGCLHLIEAARASRLDWPLVVVGDGPLRTTMESRARAEGLDVRFTEWVPRRAVLGWLRHASMLVFPSAGPESLSRVLLEASALGVPIAAMNTGGTGDIVVDGVTGILCEDAAALGSAVARLRADADVRTRLGRTARQHVRDRFETGSVAARLEVLYDDLVGSGRTRPGVAT